MGAFLKRHYKEHPIREQKKPQNDLTPFTDERGRMGELFIAFFHLIHKNGNQHGSSLETDNNYILQVFLQPQT